MRLADFDFELPAALIAQTPVEPRDAARLLVLDRASGRITHGAFRDLPALLRPGDALVLNDTKVIPARLRARRGTGGQAEVVLLRPVEPPTWEALVRPGRRLRNGAHLVFAPGVLEATMGSRTPAGTRLVTLHYEGDLSKVLAAVGEMPTPPYIRTRLADGTRYQTVFARAEGAVAAPTAGLHFTQALLAAIRSRGVAVAFLTLHVGLGTFRPVVVEDVTQHRMDDERFEISDAAASAANAVRRRGGRRLAVGTTCVRALESAADEDGTIRASTGVTRLFITPGYRFRAVDALVTNFHLPKSTLLMLVSAFAGRERVLAAYGEAIRAGYRFYSFGDAMLIL